jgi:hypothetical protein
VLKRPFSFFLLISLSLLFALGLGLLLRLRYQEGDVFPAYSSLRADPLGVRALFEALNGMNEISVTRNFRSSPAIAAPGESTLLYAGVSPPGLENVPGSLFETWEHLLSQGGRLVMAFSPQQRTQTPIWASDDASSEGGNEIRFAPGGVDLRRRWNLNWEAQHLPRDHQHRLWAGLSEELQTWRENQAENQPPAVLEWHSYWTLASEDPAWKTVYACDGHPVAIKRSFGMGAVVLVADSFHLSNEALLRAREPEYLAWLIGTKPFIIFDEAHLGLTQAPGTAHLIRSYRLHGFVIALFCLALLYVWNRSSSLVPRDPSSPDREDEVIAGKDSSAGLINLLRRSVPSSELLTVCLDHWKADCLARSKHPGAKLKEMELLVDSEQSKPRNLRDPSAGYNRISRALSERKFKSHETHTSGT